ncbi:phosphate/phosphite/phosphonate ABC transporter substrate-binding protein [uncultured Azonexus sp.]|uniref:phosphate/phosphite/phosphonate ABC transporter substrate-binding protein n=1 Tax=uncultured Azonexus sp. TaxID=520307 RepID=UPI002611C055|nr:phosphate/phosphite/phosphonate ABC transporter substrate-binding protein [uncultured Azonexus sp.]
MRHLSLFVCALSLALGLILQPASAAGKPSGAPLTVGIVPYMSTGMLLRTHAPLAKSLESSLQRPINLRTAPDYQSFFQRLRAGDYDIAITPPHYGWLAIRDHGFQPLLVHRDPIRGILVSATDQPVNNIADLRGASIAVTDRSALMAILGAQTLADEGLVENRDYQFVSAVSHSSAIHNAITGKTRAALVNATSLVLSPPEIRQRTQVWRDLAVFPGQFYIAHARLGEDYKAVIAALQAFERSPAGREFFTSTAQGGFRALTADDRKTLERALPETRRLLRETAHQ